MSADHFNHESPLLVVVENIAQQQNGLAASTISHYRLAVRRFQEFRGSPQRVSDVTPELLIAFGEWLNASGFRADQCERAIIRVSSVVHRAAPDLLPRRPRRVRPTSSAEGEWTMVIADLTFDSLLFDAIRTIASSGGVWADATAEKYRLAVRRFEEFRSGPQRVSDATPKVLEAFDEWMESEGRSKAVRSLTMQRISHVVRRVAPDLLPKLHGGKSISPGVGLLWQQSEGSRTLPADKIAGTIESILVNDYFPVRSRIANKKTERMYAFTISKLSRFLERPATLLHFRRAADRNLPKSAISLECEASTGELH